MGKFLVKQTKTGYTFVLMATNGQVIANSQVYKSLTNCKKGIDSVMKNAAVANIEDQTSENFEKMNHPKFELYVDKAGEFRFRLKAGNGQIIATGEGYTTLANCKKGVASIQKNAPDAKIVIQE